MEFRSAKFPHQSPAPPRAEPDSATLRAFALLEHIAGAHAPPTLEDLTRASGLPKPSVYRILRLLMRARCRRCAA